MRPGEHRPDWPDRKAMRAAFHHLMAGQPEPDAERALGLVKGRYARYRQRRRRVPWYGAAAVAATFAVFVVSVRAGAVPVLVARFEDSWVGGTVRNIRAYLSPGAAATLPPPAVEEGPETVTRKFIDLAAAERIIVPDSRPPVAPDCIPVGRRNPGFGSACGSPAG